MLLMLLLLVIMIFKVNRLKMCRQIVYTKMVADYESKILFLEKKSVSTFNEKCLGHPVARCGQMLGEVPRAPSWEILLGI